MLRVVASTCGVIVEALMMQRHASASAVGVAVCLLMFGLSRWWRDACRFADSLTGLDLAAGDGFEVTPPSTRTQERSHESLI
jgi:hypothetical protein